LKLKKQKALRKLGGYILIYLAVAAIVCFFMFPIFWELLTSFKSAKEVVSTSPSFIFRPTLASWSYLSEINIFHNFKNTLIVASCSTIIATLFGALAAYAIIRSSFKGRKLMVFEILTLRMVPPVAFVVPIFILWSKLNLINTYQGLILMYTAFNLPFSIWLMIGYFKSVPTQIGEAAMIDGCSHSGVFWRIVLPIAKPGLAAVAVFCMMFSWNEFMFATLLTRLETATLTVETARRIMIRTYINWSGLAGISIFTISVPLIFAIIIQKQLVKGISMGAVK